MQHNLDNNTIFELNHQFAENANLNQAEYLHLTNLAHSDYLGFWAQLAQNKIIWNKKFSKILNQDNPPFYKWFEDGTLNVSYNCLDRHLENNRDKIAIIFESDDLVTTKITYQELFHDVCTFANGLKNSA